MATPAPTKRLDLLLRLSQDLNASLEPATVLRRVSAQVPPLVRAERAFVLLAGEQIADPHTIKLYRQALESREAVIYTGEERASLCVPMFGREGPLGVLFAERSGRPFNNVDRELLTAIAASAAIALENARLHQDSARRLERLDFLHRISKQVSATLELQSVLDASVRAMQDLLDGQAASILMVEGDELVFQVAQGVAADTVKPFRIPITHGLAGWVATHCEPVIVNDAQNDPRHFSGVDAKSGFLTQNILAVPLLLNEKVLGVVEVFNRPGGFTQDDLDLLTTFASTIAFAIENARLYQVAVEKGRLERELQMASRVQASLVPSRTPKIDGWEIAARWLPAREVAGDYYDFIPLDGGSSGLVIADVADKGMPAALFMAFVRSTLRASLTVEPDPSHAFSHANVLTCADAPDGMFVTIFYLGLKPGSGELTYVNAGHNPPLLCRASRPNPAGPELLGRTGVALGLDAGMPYNQKALEMVSGDLMVLYTDGVTDALNPQGEEYGMERLMATLAEVRQKSAEEIAATIENELQTFMDGRDPYDDVTLLIVRRV